jgi:putative hydrolase of the HAD superfamily
VSARIRCRAVCLDAGGVIVLPDRHLLASALGSVGIHIDPAAVPSAHYRAVRTLDRSATTTPSPGYAATLFPQLGILPGRSAEALAVWERLADRRRSGHVLWSEPVPGGRVLIDRLRGAGIAVVVVTNSDGHGEENLRASGFADIPVIDSTVVAAAKPDPRIFEIALARAGELLRAEVSPADAVHVGDTLSTDIVGAHAAGIAPIHLDPLRACRASDHLHVRTLAGLWHHVSAPAR